MGWGVLVADLVRGRCRSAKPEGKKDGKRRVEEREVDRHGGHVEGRRKRWTMAMVTAMEQQEANLRVGFGGVVKAVGRRSSAGY